MQRIMWVRSAEAALDLMNRSPEEAGKQPEKVAIIQRMLRSMNGEEEI